MMKAQGKEQVLLPAPPGPNRPYEISLIAAHVFILNIFYICSKAAFVDFKNVESALAFYGVYHREPLNQVIHFFGVPLILWTLLVFTSHMILPSLSSILWTSSKAAASTPTLIIPNLPGIPAHYMTWATLWDMLYVAFYLKIDYIGALLYLPFLYIYYATAVRWTRNDQQKAAMLQAEKDSKDKSPSVVSWLGTKSLVSWACLIHAFAWYVQIHPGHHIIEGAAPAVLQNLGGALMAAPLFAFYEFVWLCGLQTGMQERVLNLVQEYSIELCQKGVVMRACQEVLAQVKNAA